jgi:hypothetical protein
MFLPFERRRAIYISIGLFIYFCICFLMLVHAVEENKVHPWQGSAHDQNGMPIAPK